MHVGFIYNIPTEELLRERPEMTLRDSDAIETIQEVTRALEAAGHTVTGLNADQRLPAILTEKRFDIVFNIATGVYGEMRQSHVPAMLEYLRIPHTGGGIVSEALTYHKGYQKNIYKDLGIPTAPYQVFRTGDEILDPTLGFPVIAKLCTEGASMGLDYGSVIDNETDLRKRVQYLIETYQQDIIVEKYLDGREFTVAVLGNTPPYALPIAELHFYGKVPIRLDQIEDSNFELLRKVTGQDLKLVLMESRSIPPAEVPPDVAEHIRKTAIAAYQAMHCKDWARVDLRMDKAGNLYVLEVNNGPAIASDCVFAICATAAGWSYNQLVNTILNHAIERYPELNGQTDPRLGSIEPIVGTLVERA